MVYPPTGSVACEREMSTQPTHLWSMALLYLSLSPFLRVACQLHHTAVHHHPLILDCLFTCLMGSSHGTIYSSVGSSILILKLTSSRSLFLHSFQCIDIRYLEVFAFEVGPSGECGRLSQPISGFCVQLLRGFTTMRYINRHFTYLLTYLLI